MIGNEKQIKARQQQKTDSYENWQIAGENGFVPKKGEIIVYQQSDKETLFKIGDGFTNINVLKFSNTVANPIYNATPSNITIIISNAEPNSTIILEDGNYDLLKLTGDKNAISGYITYPENLTITGTHNAKIAGVSITSGIKDQMVHSAYPHDLNYGCVNPDVSDAILPQGLTFRGISFSNSFSLRNGSIDNLTFDDCKFINGSFINVDPNRMEDLYGKDYTNENDINFQDRPNYAKLTPKNLVVRNCDFSGTHPTSDLSAIRIQSVDDITIYKNIINQARYNGVNIGGVSNPLNDSYSTGKISISNNQISNTQSRSIRLYTIRDAEVLIAANELKSANKSTSESSNPEVVKASGCINTNFAVIANNTYNGSGISKDNKVTLESYETSGGIVSYGTCDTAASTKVKVVNLVGNTKWELKAGSRVSVYFTNTNTAQNAQLNINNTGAKHVAYNGRTLESWDDSAFDSYGGYAGRIIDYVYDGNNYAFIGWSADDNASKVYVQDKEPVDIKEGSLWLDTDEDSIFSDEELAKIGKIDGLVAGQARLATDIAVERARIDQFVTLEEGSTTGDAELQDIRVGWDGTQYPTAGDAIRSQVKHYIQTINNGVYTIIPSNYKANLTVTQHEGVVSAKFIKPEDSQPSYTGFSIKLGKTGEQLIGKRVIIMLDKVINLNYIALSPSAGSWQTVVKFTKDSNTEWHIDVTENDIETLGTGNIYLVANVNPNKSWEVLCTAYVIDANVFGLNMANSAFFAHKVNPDNIINNAILATNAGYSYIKETAYIGATNNDGYANVTKNHVELMVGNATGSTFYTRASFDISQIKDNIKYIIFNGDTVNSLYITRTKNDWSQVITTLKMGINDVAQLDLSEESQVYLMIGNYGTENVHSELDYYIITKENMVIATTTIEELTSTQTDNFTYITCWGDSLTAGGGWTSTLANLTGITVNNAGTGGENARTIMARQGADVMIVNNITIPADTTAVQIATYSNPIKTEFGHNATPLLQGGAHVNPVNIGGVEGTLKWTGSAYNDTTGTWTFTRSKAGSAVVINRPTAIVTKADREWNEPHLMIIFMGQNGGYSSNAELVQMHRLMMAHAKAKHTVILGLSSGTASGRAEYETAMREAFGRYFISLREYLSTYGLADAGLTPTDTDIAAMEIGQVPPQLLADSVHYTSTCKTVIGNMLYKKCCELGIF